METNKVYAAIAAVQADLAKSGIAKDRANQQQGFKFRGIDDIYNALAPLLSKHKLCILPRVLSREITERVSGSNRALFYVIVHMEFDLVSAEDGSRHIVSTYGEAMDSADKATNKAMSAAYKYACIQAFCIPTEGDNDADHVTHDVQPATLSAEQVAQLADKIGEVKADTTRFLKFMKVERLEDIPQGDFERALKALARKQA